MSEFDKNNKSEINYKEDEFKNMMDRFDDSMNVIEQGQKIEAVIISKGQDLFYLDLGGRFEGEIPIEEFIDPESIFVGDKVEVFVKGRKRSFYTCSANPVNLSSGQTLDKNNELDSAFENGDTVTGKVTGVNKGGLEILVSGRNGFCPFSQLEKGQSEDPDKMVNKVLQFKIIEYNEESDKLVLGRRDIIREEKYRKKIDLIQSLDKKAVYKGVVTNIKNYGVFVDIGGVEGLLHVSEISNEKVADASDVFKPGEEVDVTIKDVDIESMKISLTRKELLGDPWIEFTGKYSAGDKLTGTVSALRPYGAFIDLGSGIRGLLHVSKIGDNKFHKHAKEVFRDGDKVDVWIEKINEEEKKISLTKEEPKEDISGQLKKLKLESDKKERSSSGNAFGQLLDNALSGKTKEG